MVKEFQYSIVVYLPSQEYDILSLPFFLPGWCVHGRGGGGERGSTASAGQRPGQSCCHEATELHSTLCEGECCVYRTCVEWSVVSLDTLYLVFNVYCNSHARTHSCCITTLRTSHVLLLVCCVRWLKTLRGQLRLRGRMPPLPLRSSCTHTMKELVSGGVYMCVIILVCCHTWLVDVSSATVQP